MRQYLFALAAVAIVGSSAQAQTVYQGTDVSTSAPTNSRSAESAFKSSLLQFGTETFSSQLAWAATLPVTYGSVATGSIVDPNCFSGFPRLDNLRGLQGARGDGTSFCGFAATATTFSFSRVVQGFGFFASGTNDIGDVAGARTISLDFLLGGSSVYTLDIFNPSTDGLNTMFIGVSGISFDAVSLRGQNADGVWFNDVTAGVQNQSVVPEPATFALMGVGLVGLGVAARRRRSV